MEYESKDFLARCKRYFNKGLESLVSLRLDSWVIVMVVRMAVRKEAMRTGSEKRSEDRTENESEKEGEGGSGSNAFDSRCPTHCCMKCFLGFSVHCLNQKTQDLR
jgi:hypothetical protein